MKDSSSVLNIEHWNTPQNMPVYFVRTAVLPMVDMQLIFNAGSAYDSHKNGIADLTISLLNEGNAQYSADEIARRFEEVGTIYSSGLCKDTSRIHVRSLTDNNCLNASLSLFHSLFNPSFPEASVERIKNQMFISLEDELQHPQTVASQAFYRALYPKQAYCNPIGGYLYTVPKLTRQDVLSFYQDYYARQNAILLLVGDLTIDQAKSIASSLSEVLPTGQVASTTEKIMPAPAKSEALNFPSQQTSIYLGQLGISPQDTDYFPLMIGNYILGGGGMTSRLFHTIREQKGLVYSVYSALVMLLRGGPFYISLQTRNTEAENAIQCTLTVLQAFLKTGPTEAELLAAQKNLVGGFPLELAGNHNILHQLASIGLYKFPLDYLDTYREKILAVNTKQIHAAFQQHIQLDQWIRITVGEIL